MGKDKNKINIKERIDDITIDLSLSDISEIPVSGIANHKRQTILDLSSNKITTLGKNFCSLTHLTKLDLSKNQLKFLPEDISKLTNLRHLDLYNNQLEHLPLGFGKLKSLRYLDLKGNPLTPALANIVGPCLTSKECQNSARTTVKFFAELQKKLEEEREQALKEQLELEEAEKEKEAMEAAKEKAKVKPKKEKKKEVKPKVEPLVDNALDNSDGIQKESKKRSFSIVKVLCYMFSLWFLFAVSLIFVFSKNPHLLETLLRKLPRSYQQSLQYHLQKIQQELLKYKK